MRYNEYLESSAYEDPEDIPVAADDEDEEEEEEDSVKNRIDMPIFHTVICDEHK